MALNSEPILPLPPCAVTRPVVAANEKVPGYSMQMRQHIERFVLQLKQRFVEERVQGFTKEGTVHPPVSREEAEARWLKAEPGFRGCFYTGEEYLRAKFGVYPDESVELK